MMDLPLAMMTPNAAPQGGGTATGGHAEDPAGFAATLTSMLGDAGREVVEMVETLETLAGLDSADREQLATVGWPLPAFLALSEVAAGTQTAEEAADEVPPDVGALLDQLAEIVTAAPEDADPSAAEVPGGENGGGQPAEELPVDVNQIVEGPVDVGPVEDAAVAAAAARAGSPADGERPEQLGTDRAGNAARNVEVAVEDAERARNRGQVTADVARTRGDERAAQRAADGAAPDRNRVTGTVPTAFASDPSSAEGAGDTGVLLTGAEMSRRAAEHRPVGLPSAVQRIIDAVERLENMPPPRQLTLELGDIRLRVSMEDGQVRLALLDTEGEAADELLRDAMEELAQRGFDLGDGERGGSDAEDRDHAPAMPPGRRPAAATTAVRNEPAGALRL